ncbi:anhydro-N-acetylmuramic acid kinase [Capnocytophaga canimorsus]|uniref:anhydro-N-acetylmuramic acid kinase n=1 Tax=Capnocytophaga canimorsus TaxID=28188 RepID=UPI000BB18A11|nr:anhydro-N-acetylmuramic acid kinase [Capnocytophaga canimorsus]ATA76106.1 anhydro-N-acetylmuramic acid kinase [Capnocytophaga canimorsus]PJI80301.1 anhydro-N-acetylmuramic acid kinase [Capnocytophaga canimorsus]STA71208.1 Anhydro-N-acetylmuramic acid kinase [Capnocytophaga canimorsus]
MKGYKIIGLMSGTSLDGLDIAFCHFKKENEQWFFDIEAAKSISYDQNMRESLKNAVHLSAEQLLRLHNQYGKWLGEQTQLFISEKKINPQTIASHGHTVFHQPQNGFTLQIGSGQHLSNVVQLPVICDFRVGDVALGGQGAPLVPIGDQLLFAEFDFCLNLGGISNISFEREGKRIAYDIGIANMILNHLCRKIGKNYDHNGNLAKNGKLLPTLLERLNKLPYYQTDYPKSTGFEWFSKEILPIVESIDAKVEDLLYTAVHHICGQIKINVEKHLSPFKKQKLLITGGGALNTFLIETLKEKLDKQIEIIVPEKQIIEFKEALIFAFMGVLRLENQINILSSVTGARKDSCGGILFLPQ